MCSSPEKSNQMPAQQFSCTKQMELDKLNEPQRLASLALAKNFLESHLTEETDFTVEM